MYLEQYTQKTYNTYKLQIEDVSLVENTGFQVQNNITAIYSSSTAESDWGKLEFVERNNHDKL